MFLENMLGAPPASILLPFMVEMTVLLLLAAVVATVMVLLCIFIVPFFAPSLALEAPFRAFSAAFRPLLFFTFPWMFILELCILPVIAYIGTFLGAGRKMLSPTAFLNL